MICNDPTHRRVMQIKIRPYFLHRISTALIRVDYRRVSVFAFADEASIKAIGMTNPVIGIAKGSRTHV